MVLSWLVWLRGGATRRSHLEEANEPDDGDDDEGGHGDLWWWVGGLCWMVHGKIICIHIYIQIHTPTPYTRP